MSIYGTWPDEVEVTMGRTGYRVAHRGARTGEISGTIYHVKYDDLEALAGTRNPHGEIEMQSGEMMTAWRYAQHHGVPARMLRLGQVIR